MQVSRRATASEVACRCVTPSKHLDVAIVGAGPAGLATAAALHRADPALKLQVFERTVMAQRGAALLVMVNGFLALEAIDKQLPQELLTKAIRVEGTNRYDRHTGQHLQFVPLRNDIDQEEYGYHASLLGWSDVTAGLASALPEGSITPSCPVTAFKQQPDGTIQLLSSTACSQDSSSGQSASSQDQQRSQGQAREQEQEQAVVATCRALIGADGCFSPIRQQLLGDGPPELKDLVVYRARIVRPQGFPAQRNVSYVPAVGLTVNSMLAILTPMSGGDLAWQAHVPIHVMQEKGLGFTAAEGEAGSGGGGSRGRVKERCLWAFEGFAPGLIDVIRATPAEAITEHGLYVRPMEHISEQRWGRGMVTLVGDAAHTSWADGTGLALALEDAAVLGWHVQQQGLTSAAFRAFEAERVPRIKAVLQAAETFAAKFAQGAPLQDIRQERAQVLYGQAKFKKLGV